MDKLYGTLGAFLVLMTWLYLTAFALLIGGELNGQVRWRYLERPHPKPVRKPVFQWFRPEDTAGPGTRVAEREGPQG